MLSLPARSKLVVDCRAAFLKACNALAASFIVGVLVIWNVVVYFHMSLCRLVTFLEIGANAKESLNSVEGVQLDD